MKRSGRVFIIAGVALALVAGGLLFLFLSQMTQQASGAVTPTPMPDFGGIKLMSRFTPKSNQERLSQSLEQAGNPNGWSPTEFMGVRGLSAVALGGATLGLMVLARQNIQALLLFPDLIVFVGYILPGIWLDHNNRRRKMNIV